MFIFDAHSIKFLPQLFFPATIFISFSIDTTTQIARHFNAIIIQHNNPLCTKPSNKQTCFKYNILSCTQFSFFWLSFFISFVVRCKKNDCTVYIRISL